MVDRPRVNPAVVIGARFNSAFVSVVVERTKTSLSLSLSLSLFFLFFFSFFCPDFSSSSSSSSSSRPVLLNLPKYDTLNYTIITFGLSPFDRTPPQKKYLGAALAREEEGKMASFLAPTTTTFSSSKSVFFGRRRTTRKAKKKAKRRCFLLANNTWDANASGGRVCVVAKQHQSHIIGWEWTAAAKRRMTTR